MEQPINFVIDVRDFDLNLLSEDSREVGTDQFAKAVSSYYAQQFAPLGGSVAVAFSADAITVSWVPDGASVSPQQFALSLLREGKLDEAIPLLRLLALSNPDDSVILYNLGMAESDLGELDEAVSHLKRATGIDPSDSNAYVALSVAQKRMGDSVAAISSLERAVEIDPANGHAHINLGAVLGTEGRNEEARHRLREAVRLLPDNQRALYGLAYSLEHSGNQEDVVEADALYKRVIALDSQSEIAELARRARTGLAQTSFRNNNNLPIRMDAVMYCLGALQKFAKMSPSEVQAVAFEIAMLGQKGLDPNNSELRYTLRSLPGDYSALHLLSMMYCGFKQLAPDKDIGFDLSREYAAAQKMHRASEV